MKLIKESLVIAIAIAAVFVITQALGDYIIPILVLLAIFAAIYVLIRRRTHRGQDMFTGSYLEFSAITIVILLLIFYTGGINSQLYFLTYFLLFGLSFIFEPLTIFVFLIGLVVIFLPQAINDDLFGNSIRLGSLVLLSPIAYFFGRELKRREKEEIKK